MIGILFSLTTVSCRYYNLEKRLDPEYKEFLSRVRYIITRGETRRFLDLPDAEKEAFREEFWKKRDPVPSTEENEFKMEYEDRIERADEIFVGEGKPGFRTDRGRIYVLFGPPMDRITYSSGSGTYRGCREEWYYGGFPVIFRDEQCIGHFRLATYDFSSIQSLNLMYIHELNKAEMEAQQTIQVKEQNSFDFDWKVKTTQKTSDFFAGYIFVEIPYIHIWFEARDDMLVTTLEFHLKIRDETDQIVWDHKDSFPVETEEERIDALIGKKLEIKIPFTLEKELDRLRQGKYLWVLKLTNLTDGKSKEKVKVFKF